MSDRSDRVRWLFDELADLDRILAESQLNEVEEDASIREEVLELLFADDAPHGLLDASPDDLAAMVLDDGLPLGPERWVGTSIGRYQIEKLIGTGGMGTVFLAVRPDLGLRVALKLVRGALGDPERISRFRQEERVLAQLSHPNIAQILDAGVTDDGTPWLAMGYVEGIPITEWCRKNSPDVASRLRLFLELCDAVGFAHQNLIVHRDLKPSNVLVTPDGGARLLDFGVAKLLEPGLPEQGLTRTGLRVLSPEYAAPEQILGHAITTATDVYGLGLLLFEMLTLERPFLRADVTALGSADLISARQVPRPSTRIGRLSGSMADLDAICLKALENDPARRYSSVAAFRADIVRYLQRLPVSARLPTRFYRAGKFLRRNRVGVTIASLLGALLLVAGGTVGQQAFRAREALEQSRDLSAFLAGVFRANDPAEARGAEVPMKSFVDLAQVYLSELENRPPLHARTVELLSQAYLELGEYERAIELAEQSIEERRALGIGYEVEVASSLRTQGRALFESDDARAAANVLRPSLALQRQALGDDHPETTETMLLLSDVILSMGEAEAAERLSREAMARRLENRRPGDTEAVVTAITQLGRVVSIRGQHASEAEALIRQGLRIREILHGSDDFRIDPSLTALAEHLTRFGGAVEAEALARRSLEIRRTVFGDGHIRVASQLNAVAAAMRAQGRFEESHDIYRQVVRRFEDAFDGDHLMLALAVDQVGRTFEAEGRLDSAAVNVARALEMRIRLEGEEDPDVAELWHRLGDLQRRQGRLVQAEGSLREAARQNLIFWGPDAPPTLMSEATLGVVLGQNGDVEAGEQLIRRAVQVRRATAPRHADVIIAWKFLGRVLSLQGRQGEAEEAYRQGLQVARTERDAADSERVAAAREMMDFYRAIGRPDEAERIRQEEVGSVVGAGRGSEAGGG